MKKVYLIIAATLLSLSSCFAGKQTVQGKIFFENDTLSTTLFLPSFNVWTELDGQAIQTGIKYLDKNGKKQKLKTDGANGFEFKYKFKKASAEDTATVFTYHSKSETRWVGALGYGDKIFLQYLGSSKRGINVYYFIGSKASNSMVSGGWIFNPNPSYALEKHDQALTLPLRTHSTFKKNMSAFFSDCPELAEKIKNKEFTSKDFDQIIDFYDNKCK